MDAIPNPTGIAVIGMSCRLPGANDPQEFWTCLSEKRDLVGPIPQDRPYLLRKGIHFEGGFLKCSIDSFDAKFFGFSPREAPFVDPQQRILLEVSWEALENAGINPHSLKGSPTGVFVGIWQQDYDRMLPESCFRSDDFHRKWLCNAFSSAATRLSHILGLNGPSVPVEAACASSLAAIHVACESLRRGETDLAISSGVNLILDDTFTTALKGSAVLAPDFRCKTFDVAANGYVRSEGCGVVILKRLNDAMRDGDNILGVILGSAYNSDGAGTGFGTPNPMSQAKVFKSALDMAGVRPEEVSYVEAHGTGTAVGDLTELNACKLVYATQGGRSEKLVIGSVKANIGHCEAAAGIASLIKVLLCFKHNQIPPQIHLKNLNPKIAPALEQIPAKIPLEPIKWEGEKGPIRIAAINTFGMSGTNVGVVLREAGNFQRPPAMPSGLAHILTLSAKSHKTLTDLQASYASFVPKLKPDDPNVTLDAVVFTASIGRAHFPHRMTILAEDLTELGQKLLEKQQISEVGKGKKKIAFLFPGQGSQYFGMGKGLYSTSSKFRTEFQKVDDAFSAHFGISLATVVWEIPDFLEYTLYCQPAIFCVQTALARFWKTLGVIPDVVLGHSVGEFAAAVCAGVVSFEDALKMVVGRSRLISSLQPGAMLALSVEKKTLATLLEEFKNDERKWVDVAAVNSPTDVVVSGPPEAIDCFAQLCTNNGIKFNVLRASNAFHSRDMDAILDSYAEILSEVSIHQPRCTYISGATGELETEFNVNYWKGHVRNSVRFSSAIQTLGSMECPILLEVGTSPVLLGLTAQNLGEVITKYVVCPTLRRHIDNRRSVLETLEKLYRNGVDIDWNFWYDEPRRKIPLPTYPFQKQQFWIEADGRSSTGSSGPTTSAAPLHPFLGHSVTCEPTENRFLQTINLDQPQFNFLKDHKIGGKLIFPAAGFLEIILGAAKVLFPQEIFTVRDFELEFALSLNTTVTVETRLRLVPVSNSLQLKVEVFQKLHERYQRLVSAFLVPSASDGVQNLDLLKKDVISEEVAEGVHAEFFKLGFTFGLGFQSIVAFWCDRSAREVLTEVRLPGDVTDYVCHPLVTDAMIQSAVYSILRFAGLEKLALPIKFAKFTWFGKPFSGRLFMRTSWAEFGDIYLYNDHDELLAVMGGLDFHYIPKESFVQIIENREPTREDGATFYTEIWKKEAALKTGTSGQSPPRRDASEKTWLIMSCDGTEISEWVPNMDEIGKKLVVARLLPNVIGLGRVAGSLKLSYEDPEDLQKFIGNIPDLEAILYVDLRNETKDAEGMVYAQNLTIQGMLNFAKALINLNLGGQVSIFGVTRSVFAVDRSSSSNPFTATVQGFLKAFKTEHPEMKIYSLDVDATVKSRERLVDLIQSWDPAEPVKALRNGATYVPRISVVEIQDCIPHQVFRDDATYLVTGGTKGIGFQVVQWMVSNGAKSVVITSRNAPDAASEKLLESYRVKHECQIEFVVANVGDLEDCRKLLNAVKTMGLPKLAGVFHSAGVLEDGLIPNQTLRTFAKSYEAKVYGAWNLHTLTTDGTYDLDYFVLFSSIVSMIGNVGQSNYISANQFLDVLAHFRVSLGLPGISINWGPWSEVGMANDSRLGQDGALGMRPISTKHGIEALGKILGPKTTQVAVLGSGTNFSKISEILPMGNYLVDVIPIGAPTEADREGNSGFCTLQNEIKNARNLSEETVKAYLEMLIRQTLRLSTDEELAEDQPFTELGMDSLMSVEVRGHLMNLFKGQNPGVGVSMSLVQENNTLRSLTTFVINNSKVATFSEDDLRQLVLGDLNLPESVTCAGMKLCSYPSKWERIFVTGATGFVGAHFVSFLNGKGLRTSCLVRGVKGQTEGRAKLEAAFRKFQLCDTMDMSLVDVVLGDITSDTLGLSPEEYQKLSLSADAVVHCTALVNHIDEYAAGGQSSLRTINVLGLVNVLRFAGNQMTKPVLYCSTLTAATQMDNKCQILDEFPPDGGVDPLGTFNGGYTLSKFIAEVLLRQAHDRGIPCLVLRFPTLLGHSRTGHFPTKYNQFSRLLLSCIRIGRIPDWGRKEIPVMPVDEAVKIAGIIFLKDDAQLGVYNLTFSGMPTEDDFLSITFGTFGVVMVRIPFLQWTQLAIQGEGSLMRPFRDLYEEKDGEMPKVTRWNILYTKLLSAKLGVTSGKLLKEIGDVDHLISTGMVILQLHLDYVRESQPGLLDSLKD